MASQRTPESFIASLKAELKPVRTKYAESGSSKRLLLSTVVRACGQKNATKIFRARLHDELKNAGIATDRELIDPGLTASDSVRFALKAFRPTSLLLPTESDLERFVVSALGSEDPFRGLRLWKAQHKLPSGRRPDLICREGTSGLVVIEVKRDLSGFNPLTQILGYLDELQNEKIAVGKTLRGLIVTGSEDDNLAALINPATTRYEIQWWCYEIVMRKVDLANRPQLPS